MFFEVLIFQLSLDVVVHFASRLICCFTLLIHVTSEMYVEVKAISQESI